MRKDGYLKKILTALLITVPVMTNAENIFFEEFKTTHNVVPFDRIEKSFYEEAVDSGIKVARKEIDAIVNQRSMPTFENTIVALEDAGAMLNRTLMTFYPILSADGDDEMNAISLRISPKLSEYQSDISLNERLWERIKYVYDNREKLNLDTEDSMLLEKTYDSFLQSGANLKGTDRDTYRKLTAELSELTLKFEQNTVKATAAYEMWLKKEDLAGLPESSVEAAAVAAKEKGREGEYLITLQAPCYMAFMKYSDRRDLREKLYRDYNSQCTSGEYDNRQIMCRIAEIRMQIANLMGYKTYADYSLKHTMAETKENVYKLLDQLRDAYKPAWKKELKELTEYVNNLEGKKMDLQAWDYSYYANKLKNERYSFNEEELRPYFELNNVIDGVFGLATKLYGLQFTENQNISVYNPEVKSFDVTDAEGNFVGVLYTDFFPRATKRSGAWMTEFRSEKIVDGVSQRPHVTLTMNFTRPTEDKPSLLTFYEVETFIHEFGHGLHSLLTQAKYASLSGTSVYRDFVEVPSQFNENFLTEKEFLDSFAKHYITGESIPRELVDKVIASSRFGAARDCLRQLSFGYLDMAYHTITAPITEDTYKFEVDATKSVELFPEVKGCYTSPMFNHIFSGGYAAGYYSYKWSEEIEADAFQYFKDNGIFNPEIAKSWRDNVLSRGGTEPPMTLYKRFRGQEPTVDALLIRDGIKKAAKGK